MHIPLLRHGLPNHGASPRRPAHSTLQTAFNRLHLSEPLTSADQEVVNRVSTLCARFVGRHLDGQAVLVKAQAEGKLYGETDLYTEEAFIAKLNDYVHPLQSAARPHALLIARLDDYADLCEKFGDADAEDEFLLPAGAALQARLPQGGFAGRIGLERLAAFMPETDLITANLFGKAVIHEIATTKLPRTVDGFSHLGMSVGLEQLNPGDDLAAKLAAINQQLEAAYQFGHDVLSDEWHFEAGISA